MNTLDTLPRKRMFPELTDSDLERMNARAWREAVRAIAEYRQSAGHAPASLRAILAESANDANLFWVALRDEQVRRNGGEVAE